MAIRTPFVVIKATGTNPLATLRTALYTTFTAIIVASRAGAAAIRTVTFAALSTRTLAVDTKGRIAALAAVAIVAIDDAATVGAVDSIPDSELDKWTFRVVVP